MSKGDHSTSHEDGKRKKPVWVEGVGWRYPSEGSMKRRSLEHDYEGRSIYMLTLCTEGRRPLFGRLSTDPEPHIVLSPLGREVEACWKDIPKYYPEVELLAFQVMPDHLHGIVFVHESSAHLGKMVLGFKTGCNKAYRRLGFAEAVPQQPQPQSRPKHPEHGLLWEEGFHDRILRGKDQLQHMIDYIHDNPRRLAEKRAHSAFYTQHPLSAHGMQFTAIGNDALLSSPRRLQVQVHRGSDADIASEVKRLLTIARSGAVVVSPCISLGEKQVARAAMEEGIPLVVLLHKDFPPLYKPPGKYFEACAKGRLLLLASQCPSTTTYQTEAYKEKTRKTITRQQCLELNEMAQKLSTE